MKTFIVLVFCVLPKFLAAQDVNFEWAKQFTGSGLVQNAAIAVDATGNIYTAGFFEGAIDFDPGINIYPLSSAGNTDIFIAKMDALGNFIWAKRIGGTGQDNCNSIAIDTNGDVFITGSFKGSVDFDPGPGISNSNAINFLGDLFICKFNSSGNLDWSKSFGSTIAGGRNFVALDNNNNIYLNGNFSQTSDFDPGPAVFTMTANVSPYQNIFVSKLDNAGNFLWAKQIDVTDYNYVWSISVDGNGNIYTTGEFASTADFDPGPGIQSITSLGDHDFYILKLNATGNLVWVKSCGGAGIDQCFSSTIDIAGNIIVSGVFTGTVDFDPGPGTYDLTGISTGPYTGYLLKLDAAGNFVWAKKSLGANAFGLATDNLENVYSAGVFQNTVDFDLGPGTFNISAIGNIDIFISKFNAAGNSIWTKTLGGLSANGFVSNIVVDRNKNIYTNGAFTGTIDFDPSAFVYNLTTGSNLDMYIQKMSHCQNSSSAAITASACNSYTLNAQTYHSSGLYTQTIANATGCDSIITLDLTINNPVNSQLSVSVCDNYSWQGNIYSLSGSYNDTLVASNGCDSILTLNLMIKSKSFSTTDTTICPDQNYYGYTTAGTYTNLLIAANGCDSIHTINLAIKDNCYNGIPNAFTPNGDGLHDIFKPSIAETITNYSFTIYNRFGEKIFESKNYALGWNGIYKGKAQPPGSYVYFIYYHTANGLLTEKKGTVILFR